ncbi:MAG: CsbD family protein [Rhodopila sp.]|nr:CsbD family protein [Rhodopila sp.]
MNDRVEGAAREFGGRVQEAVGNVTGDAKTQAQGIYNQAAGQAQQAAGQLSDVVKAQPIVAMLVALGIGYVLGRLTA